MQTLDTKTNEQKTQHRKLQRRASLIPPNKHNKSIYEYIYLNVPSSSQIHLSMSWF